MELGDLVLKTLNDSSGLLLFVLGGLNELPCLLNLLSESSDGLRVLLSELDSTFDSCGILEDSVIKFLTSVIKFICKFKFCVTYLLTSLFSLS